MARGGGPSWLQGQAMPAQEGLPLEEGPGGDRKQNPNFVASANVPAQGSDAGSTLCIPALLCALAWLSPWSWSPQKINKQTLSSQRHIWLNRSFVPGLLLNSSCYPPSL